MKYEVVNHLGKRDSIFLSRHQADVRAADRGFAVRLVPTPGLEIRYCYTSQFSGDDWFAIYDTATGRLVNGCFTAAQCENEFPDLWSRYAVNKVPNPDFPD